MTLVQSEPFPGDLLYIKYSFQDSIERFGRVCKVLEKNSSDNFKIRRNLNSGITGWASWIVIRYPEKDRKKFLWFKPRAAWITDFSWN